MTGMSEQPCDLHTRAPEVYDSSGANIYGDNTLGKRALASLAWRERRVACEGDTDRTSREIGAAHARCWLYVPRKKHGMKSAALFPLFL